MRFLFIFLLLGNLVNAQALKMRGLTKGHYQVGFTDTVIFDANDWYKFGGDSINKPIWIQIWYPTSQKVGRSMPISKYLEVQCNSLPPKWKKVFFDGVQQALWVDLLRVKRNEKGQLHPSDTAKLAWKTFINSTVEVQKNAKIAPGNFPVILYRHGAQSVPFDNHLACEHWASLGYVVASAWYNWPSEDAPDFPLLDQPIDTVYLEGEYLVADKKSTYLNDLWAVANFMRSFPSVSSTGWVGIGHSMGAQRWLEYDFSSFPKVVEKIISLHTTAESDQWEELQNGHSNLIPLVNGGAKNATTPTFVLAPKNGWWYGRKTNLSDTLDDPGFFPFRKNPYTPYLFFAGPYVDHNAFISWLPWLAHVGRYQKKLMSEEDFNYYEKNWNYYRDIISLCDALLAHPKSEKKFNWPSYSIENSWKLEWFNINKW